MADPTRTDEDAETIREAGSTPGGGGQSTRPANWPGIPPPDSEPAEDEDLPEVTREQEQLAAEVAAERGAD